MQVYSTTAALTLYKLCADTAVPTAPHPTPPPPTGGSQKIFKGFAYIVEYKHKNFKISKNREKFHISFERQENVLILVLH
jgi:hypothetical protein